MQHVFFHHRSLTGWIWHRAPWSWLLDGHRVRSLTSLLMIVVGSSISCKLV